MRKAAREEWVPAFQRHLGLDHDQVMRLSETEFVNQRDYLEMEGIKPGPQPEVDEDKIEKLLIQRLRRQAKNKKPAPARPTQQRRVLTEEQQRLVDEHVALQREQDAEYEQLLAEARAKENEVQEDPLEVRRREIQEKAANLPPEPAEGLVLAVTTPDQKRIMRKFDKGDKGEIVKLWVASSESIFQEFELRLPGGSALEDEKTLEEQGIKGRTLFNVVFPK